jgi:hypothetical protein
MIQKEGKGVSATPASDAVGVKGLPLVFLEKERPQAKEDSR